MEYKIVKTKGKGYKKYGLIYSTLLYEIENSYDIMELYLHQEKVLNQIITTIHDNLYALVSCVYPKGNEEASMKYKLWEGFKPIDNEEFNVIEHANFTKTVFEDKIEGSCSILWYGLAEIDPKFYINNYMFFNYQSMRFLLLANDTQIEQLKDSLVKYLSELANKQYPYDEFKANLLHVLQDLDCIIAEAQDDSHEGSLMFYIKEKSGFVKIFNSLFSSM